ncbi:MAG: hypothetical protein LIP12_00140 [Clostridiales bacterium]|nr:hypothetical protein [Clostridiales bacterium]
MDNYTKRAETARKYIAEAGIKFSPFQLAKVFSGLDFSRYEILALIPKGNSIVIIQRCKEPENLHYCVQYGGSGKYFSKWHEVRDYYEKRWHDHKLDGTSGRGKSLDDKICAFNNGRPQEVSA